MRIIKDEKWHLALIKIRGITILAIIIFLANVWGVKAFYNWLGIPINETLRDMIQKTTVSVWPSIVAYLICKVFFPAVSITDLFTKQERNLINAIFTLAACILIGCVFIGVYIASNAI